MILAAIILFWFICSFLSYGISFAYAQRTYPAIADEMRISDMADSIFFGLFFGPIGLVVIFFLSGFCEHGFKFK